MAVDQLLMEGVGDHPILRVYGWSEPTVTFGYFLSHQDARTAFPDAGLTYVRRWTGGGIVDHRQDVTYTLVIPRDHPLSLARGAESYHVIHQALADALVKMGEKVRLTRVDEGDGGLACFTNPVAYDLTNLEGEKIAGAGQRRSRYGLLHQGSLVTKLGADELGDALASCLSGQLIPTTPDGCFFQEAAVLAADRYATEAWLKKT